MKNDFTHAATELTIERPLIYTATSKHYFYYRMFISKYVLENGGVPLNPFMIFDYFMLDTVKRDTVREANNNLVMRADEIWCFGPVSNGVLAEILLAKEKGKPIKYFAIQKPHKVTEIVKKDVELESDVAEYRNSL